MINIHINTDNDSFKPAPAAELEALLKEVSVAIWSCDLRRSHKRIIRDTNGNKVGEWEYKP